MVGFAIGARMSAERTRNKFVSDYVVKKGKTVAHAQKEERNRACKLRDGGDFCVVKLRLKGTRERHDAWRCYSECLERVQQLHQQGSVS